MRGQAALTNQQYQQMRMASYETERRMQEIAREYGQIFATFGGAIPTDPKQAENLKRALWNAAEKFHDEHMKQALEMGLGNAETLARWYDSKHGDLHVTNREREAAEKAREAADPYRLPGSRVSPAGVPITEQEGGTAQPAAPSPAPPAAGAGGGPETTGKSEDDLPAGAGWGDDQPAPPAAPPLAPSDTQPPAAEAPDAAGKKYPAVASADPNFVPQPQDVDKPQGEAQPEGGDQLGGLPRVAQADTGPGAARPPAPAPAAPAAPAAPRPEVQVPRRLTPAEQAARNANFDPARISTIAEEALITGKTVEQLDPSLKVKGNPVTAFVKQREFEIRQGLADLQRSNLQGDELIKRVREISPRMATAVEMMGNGELPMGRGGPAQFAKEPMATILALAKKYKPGMDLNDFQNRANSQRWFTSGQGQTQTIKLETALGHSKQAIDMFNAMPNRLRTWMASGEGLTSSVYGSLDPEAAAALGNLQAKIRALSSEYNSLMAMSGMGSMTERQEIKTELDFAHPERAIGQIKGMIELIKTREEALARSYERNTGKSWDEHMRGTIRNNPEGGQEAAGFYDERRRGEFQDVPGHPGVRMRQVQ